MLYTNNYTITMNHINPTQKELREILTHTKTIAVVGASSNPEKPSYSIMQKLQSAGYQVIPVNPNEEMVLGQKAYLSLEAIPIKVDMVNVFRRAEATPAIADEAVKIGAKVLWLQQGIYNEEAALKAKNAGLIVIMDLCIAVMHSILQIPSKK